MFDMFSLCSPCVFLEVGSHMGGGETVGVNNNKYICMESDITTTMILVMDTNTGC